ncbi:Nuf2 [Drosophila busckii]|uniref:Nuf2 n=1 Tax=Drosophila busckii TaxID=30019 RepID=A0A0M4E788_DROBS|nr:involucrin [Drosophila busckii]ALC38590.1 Nuf2 [Drosophila busckii]
MEEVIHSAKLLIPECNLSVADLSQPTEAIVTRILVHYLRVFGFRVEPPYNIDNENESSREKRLFLMKLCRQVQNTLQIHFPKKTYTYIDIIKPSVKKTRNTLDVLFNFGLFYKMNKREILQPIEKRHMERQAYVNALTAKRQELEQRQLQATDLKLAQAECEATVIKLSEELPKAQSEANEQAKVLQQKQAEDLSQEKQMSELQKQLSQLDNLVVPDGQVEVIKKQTTELLAQMEIAKQEIAHQQQIFKQRRLEIEQHLQLREETDKLLQLMPVQLIEDYKQHVKQQEQMEKLSVPAGEQQKAMLAANEQIEKQLTLCKEELQQCKLKYERETQETQQHFAKPEGELKKQVADIERLEHRNKQLEHDIVQEEAFREEILEIIADCGLNI